MDVLTKWYNDFRKHYQPVPPDGADPTLYQAYQAGVIAGAVSMREHAMKAVENDPKLPKESLLNKITKSIGSLSDIPTE